MNILTDRLPETLSVNGEEYRINADARTCLTIMIDLASQDWTNAEKMMILYELLYRGKPEDAEEAIRQGLRFLNCETDDDEEAEADPYAEISEEKEDDPVYYSFRKDAGLIYAAFLQVYGINLSRDALHWWEFVTLFSNLGGDTAFSNLVSLRKRVAEHKATEEEIKVAQEMGEAFYVDEPEPLTEAEKESGNKFMRLLNGGIGDD